MEQERGISVTSSVMQFAHHQCLFNLLDTPGHEDFSEDTYRTLTAVDSVLMVIDVAKGVEDRTIKLMQVCRLRDTPIITFINKLDREGKPAIDLLDEIETILGIKCAPITWPIGMGRSFKGVYHLYKDEVFLFDNQDNNKICKSKKISGINNPELDQLLGDLAQQLREEIELVHGAGNDFSLDQYHSGELSPVFFGSAVNNFGISELLAAIGEYAPSPRLRAAEQRIVAADETQFSGFVFKIQANMNPAHHDRIAFLRICSGVFQAPMKLRQVRIGKTVQISNAITFQAASRKNISTAYPGDIIGLHNHGSIAIGDTFTENEDLKFIGIPFFAPELFQQVVLKDPLRSKALHKGLQQLTEEGATQLFKPLKNNDLILGAIGVLQFEVAQHRLKSEYNVDCVYSTIAVKTARWVSAKNAQDLQQFKTRAFANLAEDGAGLLVYLAPSMVNLQLTQERWPDIVFNKTRSV